MTNTISFKKILLHIYRIWHDNKIKINDIDHTKYELTANDLEIEMKNGK